VAIPSCPLRFKDTRRQHRLVAQDGRPAPPRVAAHGRSRARSSPGAIGRFRRQADDFFVHLGRCRMHNDTPALECLLVDREVEGSRSGPQQSIVEVLTKAARLRLHGKVPVRRCNNAHVNLDRRRAANPLEFCSCSTRNNFACRSSRISEISSSSSVPRARARRRLRRA
jgi:hypothetical protein